VVISESYFVSRGWLYATGSHFLAVHVYTFINDEPRDMNRIFNFFLSKRNKKSKAITSPISYYCSLQKKKKKKKLLLFDSM
jgi:ferritin